MSTPRLTEKAVCEDRLGRVQVGHSAPEEQEGSEGDGIRSLSISFWPTDRCSGKLTMIHEDDSYLMSRSFNIASVKTAHEPSSLRIVRSRLTEQARVRSDVEVLRHGEDEEQEPFPLLAELELSPRRTFLPGLFFRNVLEWRLF